MESQLVGHISCISNLVRAKGDYNRRHVARVHVYSSLSEGKSRNDDDDKNHDDKSSRIMKSFPVHVYVHKSGDDEEI